MAQLITDPKPCYYTTCMVWFGMLLAQYASSLERYCTLLVGTFRILHGTVPFFTPRFVERYANWYAEIIRFTANIILEFQNEN